MRTKLSRRGFLELTGCAGLGLAVAGCSSGPPAGSATWAITYTVGFEVAPTVMYYDKTMLQKQGIPLPSRTDAVGNVLDRSRLMRLQQAAAEAGAL